MRISAVLHEPLLAVLHRKAGAMIRLVLGAAVACKRSRTNRATDGQSAAFRQSLAQSTHSSVLTFLSLPSASVIVYVPQKFAPAFLISPHFVQYLPPVEDAAAGLATALTAA